MSNLHVKVVKSALEATLARIIKLAEKKTNKTYPVLENFVLSGDTTCNGMATDLDTWLRFDIAFVDVFQAGQVCIGAKKLSQLLKGLKSIDDTLELVVDPDYEVTLIADNTKLKIQGLDPAKYPTPTPLELGSSPSFDIDIGLLKGLLVRTSFAVTREETQRFALAGIKFEITKGIGKCVSTDGHRLSHVKSNGLITNNLDVCINTTIGIEHVNEMIRAIDASIKNSKKSKTPISRMYVTIGKTWNEFALDSWCMQARSLPGQFPNYRLVMPKTNEYAWVADREELKTALTAACNVIQADNNKFKPLQMIVAENALKLSAFVDDSLTDLTEVAIYQTKQSKPLPALNFNASYLLDVVSNTNAKQIAFELREAGDAIDIRPQDNNFRQRYICMPQRSETAKEASERASRKQAGKR